jgi:hypothetical protein
MYVRERGILKFKPRTQFGNVGYVYLIVVIVLIILAIQIFRMGDLSFLGVLCLFLSCLFISLMLNIHGVNIDLKKRKILVYKNILWFSVDKVFDLNSYKVIYITKSKVVAYQSEYPGDYSEVYYYYLLSLMNEMNNQTIVLTESQDYKKIASAAKRLSVDLNMEIKQSLSNVQSNKIVNKTISKKI